jgi:hypothetical protein
MILTVFAFSLAAAIAAAGAASATPGFQSAVAPDPTQANPQTELTSDFDPQKVVCRNIRPPTGTRLQSRARERICQTQADWDAQSAEAQAATRDAIAGGKVNNKEFLGPGGTSLEGGPR